MGDYNGDGKTDILQLGIGTTQEANVWLSTGSSFTAMQKWSDFIGTLNSSYYKVADFNGDGKTDLIQLAPDTTQEANVWLSTGSGFTAMQKWSDYIGNLNMPHYKLADFNGDGKTDILQLGVSTTHEANVWLSTGSGFTAMQKWSDYIGTLPTAYYRLGDYNGDGKTDLMQYDSQGSRKSQVWLANAAGTGFLAPVVWQDDIGTLVSGRYVAEDFSGDGKTDLLQLYFEGEEANAWLSNGSSFAAKSKWCTTFGNSYIDNYRQADFNGDGRNDLVYLDTDHSAPILWLSQGKSFSAGKYLNLDFQNFNAADFRLGDFNGDKQSDIMLFDILGRQALVWLSKDNDFLTRQVWNSDIGSKSITHYKLGDFNGDGKTDMIQLYPYAGHQQASVWLSNGSSFDDFTIWSQDLGTIDVENYFLGDFNGDGKTDILQLASTVNQKAFVWLSNGSSFEAKQEWSSFVGDLDVVNYRLGDFNGDGRTDILQLSPKRTHKANVWLSTGKSFAPMAEWYSDIGSAEVYYYHVSDFNGNGMSDLFLIYKEGNGNCSAKVFLSTGKSFSQQTVWHNKIGDHTYEYYKVSDFTGDGKTDLLQINDDENSARIWEADQEVPDLLVEITSGRGGRIKISYEAAAKLAGAVDSSRSTVEAVANAYPRSLVTRVESDNGLDELTGTTYEYYNGQYTTGTWSEIENLGFEWIKKKDENTGNYIKTYYNQNQPYNGYISKVETYDGTGKLYVKKEYHYGHRIDDAGYAEIKFIYQKDKYTYNYNGTDTPVVYRTEYKTYDSYGQCTRIMEHGDISVTGDDRESLTFYAAGSSHYVTAPYRKEVYAYSLAGVWSKASEKRFYYDHQALGSLEKGLLSKRENENNSRDVVLTYAYDSWGNVVRSRDGRVNAGEYSGDSKVIIYDSNYRAYKIEEKNALNMSQHFYYDSLMRVIEVKDVNHISSLIEYDVFGQAVKKIAFGDSSLHATEETIIDYSDQAAPYCILVRKREKAGQGSLDTYLYYDGLGRLIQSKKETAASGMWLTVDKYYDSSGRNYKTSIPYYWSGLPGTVSTYRDSGQLHTLTEYDAAGRKSRVIKPDSTSTRLIYSQNSVLSINELGRVTEKEVIGNVSRSKNYTGQYPDHVLYSERVTHTAWDAVETVDARGNATRSSRNMLGQVIEIEDPNTGTTLLSYDANGNLTSKQDNRGYTIDYVYDALNRRLKIDYATGADVLYYYDETGHGYSQGRLTRENYGAGEKQYTYDERGRLTAQAHTIDSRTKSVAYSYDSLNRKQSMTLPDGEVINYTYDNGGALQSLSGQDNYITDIQYNIIGLKESMHFANGIDVNYDYYDSAGEIDPSSNTAYSYRLKKISSSQAGLIDLSYEYDRAGNVLKRNDLVNTAYSEVYSYDDLNRLTGAVSTAYGSKSYAYDEIDNITLKEGQSFTYQANSYQLINDGTYTYTYDNNGNLKTRTQGSETKTYYYDYENRLTNFDGAVYTYGSGFERVIKEEGNTTTRYFFSFYQEESSPGQPVKVIKYYGKYAKRSTDEGLLFFHKDHLGSTTRVTDANANPVKSVGYTPYGKTFYATGTASIKKLYTGKEKDSNSLYYYGARYYDPEIGRFITPDPAKDGLNHYAYCSNNPVRYIDPTGLWKWGSWFNYFGVRNNARRSMGWRNWWSGGGRKSFIQNYGRAYEYGRGTRTFKPQTSVSKPVNVSGPKASLNSGDNVNINNVKVVEEEAPSGKKEEEETSDKSDTIVRTEKWGIYSVNEGTVLSVKDTGLYGNRIYVKHDDGTTILYAHLKKSLIKAGDKVLGGQLLAIMGNTSFDKDGNQMKMAKHLHITFWLKDVALKLANAADPMPYIKKNHWPTNTKATNWFKSEYYNQNSKILRTIVGGHEGSDFSGNESNFIKDWQKGLFNGFWSTY